jgi:hypothetical protein
MSAVADFDLVDFLSGKGARDWLARLPKAHKFSDKELARIEELKDRVAIDAIWERRRELERFGYRFQRAASQFHSWDLNNAACVAVLTRADDHCERCGRFCPEKPRQRPRHPPHGLSAQEAGGCGIALAPQQSTRPLCRITDCAGEVVLVLVMSSSFR